MGERLRNTRHERFAREVAALTPLATAYREAGFGGDPRWHPFNASKLANKPRVRERIDELRLEFEKMSAIHVDYVRHHLLRIIEADPRDLYEPDPNDPTGKRQKLRSLSDLPRHLTSAIARLKIDPITGEPVDVTFAGKNEAAAALLRSLPGGSSGEAVANVQLNQVTRVIVAPQPVSAPVVVSEQAGQPGPDNYRSRIEALAVRRVISG
jgi:hypothetical protein